MQINRKAQAAALLILGAFHAAHGHWLYQLAAGVPAILRAGRGRTRGHRQPLWRRAHRRLGPRGSARPSHQVRVRFTALGRCADRGRFDIRLAFHSYLLRRGRRSASRQCGIPHYGAAHGQSGSRAAGEWRPFDPRTPWRGESHLGQRRHPGGKAGRDGRSLHRERTSGSQFPAHPAGQCDFAAFGERAHCSFHPLGRPRPATRAEFERRHSDRFPAARRSRSAATVFTLSSKAEAPRSTCKTSMAVSRFTPPGHAAASARLCSAHS